MRRVCRADQVRELDRRVIEDLGLPGIALMELAAHGVALAVRTHHAAAAQRGVVVVCGSGNNGGDGWAVARWLHGWGLPVAVWSLSEPRTDDAAVMRSTCARLGVPEVDGLGDVGLIVDAVLGTGLDRPVTGRYAEVLTQLEAHEAAVVAVDIPSGLHADTGEPLGPCPRAVRTVTFAREKLGMYGASGPHYTGVIDVVDIGLDTGPGEPLVAAEIPAAADLAGCWPRRSASAHKGSSGHLLVIAGSAQMAGAALLTCRGAVAGGAGLVTLLAPSGARGRLSALPPEVMWLDGGPGDRLLGLPAGLERYTALAVGPGLGGGSELGAALARGLAELWDRDPRPMVFDADALPCTGASSAGHRVLTPHPGEAARLLGIQTSEVQADRFSAAATLSTRGTAVLKGRHSLVSTASARLSINTAGTSALATAGAGDVLTGVIGALLARGCPARDAARLGVYVHGLAGEVLTEKRTEGWGASDIAGAVPTAIAHLTCGDALP